MPALRGVLDYCSVSVSVSVRLPVSCHTFGVFLHALLGFIYMSVSPEGLLTWWQIRHACNCIPHQPMFFYSFLARKGRFATHSLNVTHFADLPLIYI